MDPVVLVLLQIKYQRKEIPYAPLSCVVCTSLVWIWPSVILHLPQYKSNPCKKVCVTGWMVVLPDDPARPNIFQLNDPDKGERHSSIRAAAAVFFSLLFISLNHIYDLCLSTGNVYKFQTGSRFSAIIWHKNLEEACRSSRPQVCSAHTLNRTKGRGKYRGAGSGPDLHLCMLHLKLHKCFHLHWGWWVLIEKQGSHPSLWHSTQPAQDQTDTVREQLVKHRAKREGIFIKSPHKMI